MPMRSKKLSFRVMKRTSIVTCRSCSRRSWSSRSAICSCTSWVWLMTRLRFTGNGSIAPAPPTSSQESGAMVVVISSIKVSKSAMAAPPIPPGPKPIGLVCWLLREFDHSASTHLCQHGRIGVHRVVGRHGQRHTAHRHRAAAIPQRFMGIPDGPRQTGVVARHEVGDRDDQVADVVDLARRSASLASVRW